VIGFLVGFALTIAALLGLAMFVQALIGDPDDVVPEEDGETT
jgi:hypothetical protein